MDPYCEMLFSKQLSKSNFSCFRGIGNSIKLRGGGSSGFCCCLLNTIHAGGSELLNGYKRVSMVRCTV